MKEQDKDYLRRRFDALREVERRRLMKKAAKLKKRSHRESDGGLAAHRVPRNKRRAGRNASARDKSVEDWALELLAEELVLDDQKVYEGEGTRGTVVSTYPAWCDVRLHDREETVLCHLVGGLARSQKTALAVGDEVVAYPADTSRWVVTSVLPRKTTLSRPDPHDPSLERVIVANVDVVCAVVSVREPALHPRVIDRFWLAVQRGGSRLLVVVNKIDLLDEAGRIEVTAQLAPYEDAGLALHYVSAETGEGLDALRLALRGMTCTFIGHSGVGKSSIVNAVFPEVTALTGEVRQADGRGRHTTTRASLYEGPGETRIIDTPGVRSFGLWDLEDDEIRGYFDEFTEFAQRCRFQDCTHIHEPECAVLAAVEEGAIAEFRYETYRRLLAGDER